MATPTFTSTSRNTALQDTYKQRLKDCQDALMDNFVHIMRAAHIRDEEDVSDKAIAARERYELDVRATNIVRTAESLLRMIAELKKLLLFQDFDSLNANHAERLRQLQECKTTSEQQLSELQTEFRSHLFDLETEYYSSKHISLP